ncbi:GSCOCG00011171001-RA-CDS, partial [Cotesia congregata]
MFDDDYGTNNPISSHRANSKVGAIYVQIACIPPAIQSKVKNIFTFILFDPSLIKLLGDILGVHTITGLVQNFVANCCCRFCKNFYDNLNNIYHERFCLLRTHESFDSDLKLNNVSKTGINETCIFNDLKNFHIIDNLRCDVMHDLLE